MKKKNIIIGGIVIAVLAIGIFIISRINTAENGVSDNRDNKPIETNNAHEVVFELANADEILLDTEKEDIKFVNDNDEWGIEGIDSEDLSSAKVKGFVFSALSYTSNMILEGEDAEYGLDTPAATLTIKENDSEHIIKIGDVSASGDVCFASVDDKKFTMLMSQRERLLKDKAYYTDVSRIRIDSDEITAINIESSERTIELYIPEIARFEGNVWQMRTPYEVMANDTYIDEKVLPCLSAVTVSKKTDSLGEERAVITVKTADSEYVLKIGAVTNGETAVEYEGEIYLEQATLFSFIDAQTFEYMHKLVSYIHMDDVKSVNMEYGDVSHSFEISTKGFKADGMEAKDDASKVFYTYLIGIVANGMYSNEELGDTLLTITFNCKDNTTVNVQYRQINEYTAAVLKDGEAIFTTGIYDVEDLINKIETFYM